MLVILLKYHFLSLIQIIEIMLAGKLIIEEHRTVSAFFFIINELNELFLAGFRVANSIVLFKVDMKILVCKCRP